MKEKCPAEGVLEPFVLIAVNDRGQLMRVAKGDDADAPKRGLDLPLLAECEVDSVKDVGSHHGDLVDHEGQVVNFEDVARRRSLFLAV